MSTTEKTTETVRRLLAKAESVAGTPEADTFMEKAFALMSKYGIDAAVAQAGAGTDSSEVITWEFVATGSYRLDQIALVNAVSNALHCKGLRLNSGDTFRVYGARRHVSRVEMLAGFLTGYMVAEAGKARSPHPGIPTVRYRKSMMSGFALTIAARLRESEKTATDATENVTGTEVVLLDDAKRASRALSNDFSRTTSSRMARSSAGHAAGAAAANRVDLGGGQRIGGRMALSA